jgi:hypothetical protein
METTGLVRALALSALLALALAQVSYDDLQYQLETTEDLLQDQLSRTQSRLFGKSGESLITALRRHRYRFSQVAAPAGDGFKLQCDNNAEEFRLVSPPGNLRARAGSVSFARTHGRARSGSACRFSQHGLQPHARPHKFRSARLRADHTGSARLCSRLPRMHVLRRPHARAPARATGPPGRQRRLPRAEAPRGHCQPLLRHGQDRERQPVLQLHQGAAGDRVCHRPGGRNCLGSARRPPALLPPMPSRTRTRETHAQRTQSSENTLSLTAGCLCTQGKPPAEVCRSLKSYGC